MMPRQSPSSRGPGWPLRLLSMVALIGVLLAVNWIAHATLGSQRQYQLVYSTLIRVGIFGMLAASLNLVNGVTGQFSLGHAAFMVIGAYTGGEISILCAGWIGRFSSWQESALQAVVLVVAMAAGAITAALAGLLVGLPSLRLRGDYLAIATLGFGEITVVGFTACDPLGGATGLTGVPTVTNLFWSLLLLIATLVLLRNLQWSGPGRDFKSVREDEIAAASVGVDVVRAKVVAFVTAAAFAGVAGVLLVHMDGVVEPSQAGFLSSIDIVVMVVVGGMGSLTGSVLGAVLLVSYHALFKGLPILNNYSQYENIIYPVLLLGVMLFRREGLLGYRELAWNSFAPFYGRWRRTEKR